MNAPTLDSKEAQALRQRFGWDDLTIRRHLQQRAELSRIAEQQRAARRVMPTEPSRWGELT